MAVTVQSLCDMGYTATCRLVAQLLGVALVGRFVFECGLSSAPIDVSKVLIVTGYLSGSNASLFMFYFAGELRVDPPGLPVHIGWTVTVTLLLRAYSDGDGDLTARVRCSAFTHEVKAVDFWRRLGRLLGPFVNSTRSFNPANQGLFSTQGRPDAEKLTGKLHGASGAVVKCSGPVLQPSTFVLRCLLVNQGQAMLIRSRRRRPSSQRCQPWWKATGETSPINLAPRRRQWRQHRRWHCWRHLRPCWWPRGV